MVNEVVKYHNDLNTATMRGWTAEEMNFFFALIAKARDRGEEEIILTKKEVLEMACWTRRDDKKLREVTKRLAKNLTDLRYIEDTADRFFVAVLFQEFEIKWEGSDFAVRMVVSRKFGYILNQLDANFTKFELEEFVQLRSTYAKQAFRLLKQYRTTGWRQFRVDEFRELFSVPESFRATNIQKRILEPVQTELAPFFPGLKVWPVKKPKTQGNPIVAYRFEWDPEASNGPYEPGKPKRKRKLKQTEVAPLPGWYAETGETGPTDDLLAEIEEVRKQNKKAEE